MKVCACVCVQPVVTNEKRGAHSLVLGVAGSSAALPGTDARKLVETYSGPGKYFNAKVTWLSHPSTYGLVHQRSIPTSA